MKGDITMQDFLTYAKGVLEGFVAKFIELLVAHLEGIFADAE